MIIKYKTSKNLTNTLLVLADIHINSSLSEDFERKRLDSLAKNILRFDNELTIVLAGDTFDRNTPSLIDISIFYDFIEQIKRPFTSREIFIIDGNHDSSTFNFLPSVNFTHIKEPTVLNNSILLTPWTFTKALDQHLVSNSHKDLLLISHARCTIAPYITEEVSIEKLASSFKQVILGDIHTAPNLPFSNVMYATSPSSITFSIPQKDAHGMLLVNMEKELYEFIPLEIPSKHLVIEDNITKAKALLESRVKTSSKHFIKLRFTGTAKEIRDLNRIPAIMVVKDFVLVDNIIDNSGLLDSKLKDFLKSNVSIVDYAFDYFKSTLKINEQMLIDLKVKYEKLRTKKGVHRK